MKTRNLVYGALAAVVLGSAVPKMLHKTPLTIHDAVYLGYNVDDSNRNRVLKFQKGTNIYVLVDKDNDFVHSDDLIRNPRLTFDVLGYSSPLVGTIATNIHVADRGRRTQNYE